MDTTGGVCKTRTGYLRMVDADGKMRIEKYGWKKNADNKKSKKKKKKREMRITKKKTKNKQTNKQRKEIFFSSSCHMVGPFTYIQNVMPIVGTVLYPVIPVINVTKIRTLRSSSLNARILSTLLLWVFSLRLVGKVNSSKNRLAKVCLFCIGPV